MILTGQKIIEELKLGKIVIEPFNVSAINPNSYNYRIGSKLKVFQGFENDKAIFKEIIIPEEGYILEPSIMYLGHTHEIIGSNTYAMSLIGRSSLGRYGLFLQISANLGHTLSCHQWTLELHATQPIRIYPQMIIGQVSFWQNSGEIQEFPKKYAKYNLPQESIA